MRDYHTQIYLEELATLRKRNGWASDRVREGVGYRKLEIERRVRYR
jgi:hypothetical protein